MNKMFHTFLALILPFIGYSQASGSIDCVVGIEYSYRSLASAESDHDEFITQRNELESAKINGRIGFNYNKRISSSVHLKTGIRIASIGYKGENKKDIHWPSEYGTGIFIDDPNLPNRLQIVYDYWYLEVPIIGRYEFGDGKFTTFIETGISPHMFLTSRTKTIADKKKEISYKSSPFIYNKLHIVGIISVGMNYNLNEKLQLFAQPIFRYHFTPLVDAVIDGYLYNGGLELGVRRRRLK